MRVSIITAVVFLGSCLLFGCAFNRQNDKGNLNSEFTPILNDKTLQAKVANKDEVDSLQVAKLQAYKLGSVTIEQFIADGWDAKGPFFGLLGVIGAKHIGHEIEITIGSYRPARIPTSPIAIMHADDASHNTPQPHKKPPTIDELQELANSYQIGFDKLLRQTDETANSIWPSPQDAQALGNLYFENGRLKSILLNGATSQLGTSEADLRKLSKYFSLLGHANGCDIDVTAFTKKLTHWETLHFPPGSRDEKKYVDPLISNLSTLAAEQRAGRSKYTCDDLQHEITKINLAD